MDALGQDPGEREEVVVGRVAELQTRRDDPEVEEWPVRIRHHPWSRHRSGRVRYFAAFELREPRLQLLDPIAQQRDLRLERDLASDLPGDAGGGRGTRQDALDRDLALRAEGPVDEPRGDLAAPVPGAQRGAGHAHRLFGFGERHPPEVEQRVPVERLPGGHRVTLSTNHVTSMVLTGP